MAQGLGRENVSVAHYDSTNRFRGRRGVRNRARMARIGERINNDTLVEATNPRQLQRIGIAIDRAERGGQKRWRELEDKEENEQPKGDNGTNSP